MPSSAEGIGGSFGLRSVLDSLRLSGRMGGGMKRLVHFRWGQVTPLAFLVCCGEDSYLISTSASEAGAIVDASSDLVDTDSVAADAEVSLTCLPGLACADPGEGMLACLEDGGLPTGAIFGCDIGTCPANFRCRFTDGTQTQTACYENCGTCEGATTCADVTGTGQLGCLEDGAVPAGASHGCVPEVGCAGNATCYLLNDEGTESVCVQNCTACRPGTCPSAQSCVAGVCVPE